MRTFNLCRRTAAVALALATTSVLVAPSASLATKSPSLPKIPLAVTGAATQVSGSSATLTGSVNPRGSETTCYFQYGPTTAYGAQTPTATAGASASPTKVSQAISGLELGTTYHYRLVAVSAAGTADGQDHTFTTKKIPLKLKIAKLLGPVTYGKPFTIEGALGGTGATGRQVVLQSSPFPFIAAFAPIASPLATNSTGGFVFSVGGLTQNSELRVATLETPPLSSSIITVRVAVQVTLHMRPTGRRGYVRLYGTVTPAVAGAPVSFQLIRPGLSPVTVAGTVVKQGTRRVGRFSSLVFIRHGRGGSYQALVRVANGQLVSGSSSAILLRSAPAPVRKHR
jgi:hypothetical protein